MAIGNITGRVRWVAVTVGVAVGSALAAPAVRAQTEAPEVVAEEGPELQPGPGGIPAGEVHGFASQGFMVTTGNDYLVADSTRGSFQLSEVGINYRRELTDRLHFGLQLFAQNFGAGGSYAPQVDWFFLDYRWRDALGLRAGRLKVPFGFYNEVNDIDSARVPVLLPQSVYPLQARSFLFAQTGGELYGYVRSRAVGAFDYRLYGGTVHLDRQLLVPVSLMIPVAFNVPYAFGARLLWETPLPGLRVGGSFLRLRIDTTGFLPMDMTIDILTRSTAWLASLEYMFRALTFTAEYGRGYSKQVSNVPTNNIVSEGDSGYVMMTVAATRWFQPGLYYALKFPDVKLREGLNNKQHDVTLTLRFDLNRYWLVKLEGHYMAGTAALINPLRFGPPPADPERHWAVFLARTTVSF
jgi:hypothetical protein